MLSFGSCIVLLADLFYFSSLFENEGVEINVDV